jgi:hypothetical protein
MPDAPSDIDITNVAARLGVKMPSETPPPKEPRVYVASESCLFDDHETASVHDECGPWGTFIDVSAYVQLQAELEKVRAERDYNKTGWDSAFLQCCKNGQKANDYRDMCEVMARALDLCGPRARETVMLYEQFKKEVGDGS